MPAPKKLDLIPQQIRARLAAELKARGFADIIDVTEALNVWLEEEGLELRIGKTAVGEFSKVLKYQRDAFTLAETILADADIEAETELHRVLMQMIGASAVHFMAAARDSDGQLDPRDLQFLSRMLKDLMHSAGIREKLLADERARLQNEQAARLDEAVRSGALAGMSADTVEAIKSQILGVR